MWRSSRAFVLAILNAPGGTSVISHHRRVDRWNDHLFGYYSSVSRWQPKRTNGWEKSYIPIGSKTPSTKSKRNEMGDKRNRSACSSIAGPRSRPAWKPLLYSTSALRTSHIISQSDPRFFISRRSTENIPSFPPLLSMLLSSKYPGHISEPGPTRRRSLVK